MLAALFRTTWRLWLIMAVIAGLALDADGWTAITSALAALAVVALGLAVALATLAAARPTGRFTYSGQPVAGGQAVLFDRGEKLTVPLAPPPRIDLGHAGMIKIEDLPDAERVLQAVPQDLKSAARAIMQDDRYGTAFVRILGLLLASSRTPAATVVGGHRGATLLEHSFNVWRTMRRDCKDFVYRGMVDRHGKVYFAVIDQSYRAQGYRFDEQDPLLALAAVAHDIGKTVCYQPSAAKDNRWEERLPEHDTEGARLLRKLRLYEVMPRDEAQRLIVSVGYYHKIDSLPQAQWIDDRARALITLLYAVDVRTGELEGQGEYDAFIATPVINAKKEQEEADDADADASEQYDSEAQDPLEGVPRWDEAMERRRSQQTLTPLPAPSEPSQASAASANAGQAASSVADIDQSAAYIGRIIAAAKAVETALQEQLGATGKGLHEYVTSVEKKLSPKAHKHARQLASIRNKSAHRAEYTPRLRDVVVAEKCAQAILDEINNKKIRYESKTALDHLTDDIVLDLTSRQINLMETKINRAGTPIYKFGPWLYIYEMPFAKEVYDNADKAFLDEYGLRNEHFFPQKPGAHCDFSRRLMKALANKGALRQEWNGQYFGDSSAYFWVLAGKAAKEGDPDVVRVARSKHVIVVRAYLFGQRMFDMESARLEPIIQGSVYQPLSDPTVIARIKAKVEAWVDPPSKQEKNVAKITSKLHGKAERGEIKLRPEFEPSLITQIPASAYALAVLQHPEFMSVYVVDEILKYFDAPSLPHEVIEYEGKKCYVFSGKGRKKG